MREAGISSLTTTVDMRQLEACIRSELDLTAQRRIAVLEPVKLVVDNYPADKTEYFDVANNPNREANDTTTRKVAFTRELWIDAEDFAEVPPPKFKRLTVDGEVRLMGAYIVKCTGVDKNADGSIAAIHCTADLETGNGNPADGRKVKGTIHWVSAALRGRRGTPVRQAVHRGQHERHPRGQRLQGLPEPGKRHCAHRLQAGREPEGRKARRKVPVRAHRLLYPGQQEPRRVQPVVTLRDSFKPAK